MRPAAHESTTARAQRIGQTIPQSRVRGLPNRSFPRRNSRVGPRPRCPPHRRCLGLTSHTDAGGRRLRRRGQRHGPEAGQRSCDDRAGRLGQRAAATHSTAAGETGHSLASTPRNCSLQNGRLSQADDRRDRSERSSYAGCCNELLCPLAWHRPSSSRSPPRSHAPSNRKPSPTHSNGSPTRLQHAAPDRQALPSYGAERGSLEDFARIRALHLEYYERGRRIVGDSQRAERVVLLNQQLIPLDE